MLPKNCQKAIIAPILAFLDKDNLGGKTSETELTATVQAKVGPVKATFQGAVTLSEIKDPESYTISGEGKGGAAGFAKGTARITLIEDGNETILN